MTTQLLHELHEAVDYGAELTWRLQAIADQVPLSSKLAACGQEVQLHRQPELGSLYSMYLGNNILKLAVESVQDEELCMVKDYELVYPPSGAWNGGLLREIGEAFGAVASAESPQLITLVRAIHRGYMRQLRPPLSLVAKNSSTLDF